MWASSLLQKYSRAALNTTQLSETIRTVMFFIVRAVYSSTLELNSNDDNKVNVLTISFKMCVVARFIDTVVHQFYDHAA